MADLYVDPDYLEELAGKQDLAKAAAAEAAGAATAEGVGFKVWFTHGVISGASNASFTSTAGMRQAAAKNIQTQANDLAAKLRTAKQTYENVDDDLGQNLTKQVLER